MRLMRLFCAGVFIALVAGSQSGCLVAAAAVGTGATVAYVRGDLESTLDASPQQAAETVLAAAKEMNLSVTAHEVDGLGGSIVTRTAGDDRITIKLKAQSDRLCNVSIRAGLFGDNAIQQRMLDKIKTQLATAAAIPPPAFPPTTHPSMQADASH